METSVTVYQSSRDNIPEDSNLLPCGYTYQVVTCRLFLTGFEWRYLKGKWGDGRWINPLNAELNPICHLLALLGTHHKLHVSRKRVKRTERCCRWHSTTDYLWSCYRLKRRSYGLYSSCIWECKFTLGFISFVLWRGFPFRDIQVDISVWLCSPSQ